MANRRPESCLEENVEKLMRGGWTNTTEGEICTIDTQIDNTLLYSLLLF
jgi:hypothetical protein